MKPHLPELLKHATLLTRDGDLLGATASIQAALSAMTNNLGGSLGGGVHAPSSHLAMPRPVQRGASEGLALRDRRPNENGEFIAITLATPKGTRHGKLFVPAAHHGQAMPLMVMLHGCTQNPDDFAAGTGMNDLASEAGFFVLYPEQPPKANGHRCWNWFESAHQQRGKGEPALIAAMCQDVIAEYGIDAKRVYVAGLSAGGAMAAILGDAYPDIFAAVGVHSGLPTGSASDVKSAFAVMQGGSGSRSTKRRVRTNTITNADANARQNVRSAVATIVFHGDRDSTVAAVNGERIAAACTGALTRDGGAESVTNESVRSESARTESVRSSMGSTRSYTRTLYRDRDGKLICEHWLVHGAGHAWSGGQADGSFTDPQGPDASREMVRFFLRGEHH